jgi:hypothetical protein
MSRGSRTRELFGRDRSRHRKRGRPDRIFADCVPAIRGAFLGGQSQAGRRAQVHVNRTRYLFEQERQGDNASNKVLTA